MAYDEELAHRVRELLADEPGMSEMPMFGGLAFLLEGNLSVAVRSRGGLMLRLGADAADRALSRAHAQQVEMRGRTMTGWVFVEPAGLKGKRALASWVVPAATFTRTLPPKG